MPKPIMPLWSPEELAKYLGVPIRTVYSWNYTGTGPKFCRVGKHVRYRPDDVDAWLNAQTVQPGGAAA
ncbi:helix-turn-helix domain-containing protein [Streptomyces thermoalcalitolerans]|uniref:Helix-turn-helix domain-containing protein n=1 Tax=Streptomyces thermoalcalitolerans TaxID=65605 RepID=A0ABP3YT83_9ACTN